MKAFSASSPTGAITDFMDALLGLFLDTLGQFVEHIGCPMPPAPLPPGLAINLD